MIAVYWLEQTTGDLPAEDDWLSASEVVVQSGLRFAKRRGDWRLGRWTAKRAVAAYLNLASNRQDLANIEIRPEPSGAPEAFFHDRPAPVTISLSHRDTVGACAVTLPKVELGCDVEIVEPRSDAFIADYFTTQEHQLIERTSMGDRSRLLALLWSAKESALKSLRTGLRLDTRSVNVVPGVSRHGPGEAAPAPDPVFNFQAPEELNRWQPLQVVYESAQVFHGWWQNAGNLVRTMVASPPGAPPIFYEFPFHSTGNAH